MFLHLPSKIVGFIPISVLSTEIRQRNTEWRDLIDGTLDSALDPKGHERLAAGGHFEGTKTP